MTVQAIKAEPKKLGTCPHGNPAGACPLCNGMGGGGAKMNSKDVRRHPGEMTWNECYAMGLILKQRAQAKEMAQQRAEAQAMILEQNKALAKIAARLHALNTAIIDSIAKMANQVKELTFNKLIKSVSANIQTLAQNAVNFVKNTFIEIKNRIIDITDKLAAIYGEMKNAIEKKISDSIKSMLEKLEGLLGFFKAEETTNEEDEKEAEKERLLKFKKTLHKRVNRKEEEKEEELQQ